MIDPDMGASALRLRKKYLKDGDGFVAINETEITVYVHAKKKYCAWETPSEWEGYKVMWKFGVGPIVAAMEDFK